MDEQQDLKAWKGLKELPPDTTAFEASGTKYRVARSVSMDRWEAYELLSVEVGLGRSFAQLMQGLREAYDLTNQVASGKPVFADLAVLLRDMLMGAASVNEGHAHPVLKMCCLFINYEGEDVRTINDEIIAKKLDDWRNEGIDMGFFFDFALRSIPGFLDAYKAVTRGTLSGQKKEQETEGASTSRSASERSTAATTS